MAADPKAARYSVSWKGGYLTASLGLLEALYGSDFLKNAATTQPKTVTVKSHARQRVIGGTAVAVGGYSYSLKRYPHANNTPASGGKEVRILVGDKWWTGRLSGSIQSFKGYLNGAGAPTAAFQFRVGRSEYSSAGA